MAEKRTYRNYVAPSIVYENSNNSTALWERNEMVRLTELVKSSDFYCTFCFKTFRSAQAMGGHQNAHKAERLEEKRLFVKDPIGHRKRAYLRAMKPKDDVGSSKMVNRVCCCINCTTKIPVNPNMSSDFVESNDENSDVNGKRLRIFLPIKELSLANKVGVHADESGKGHTVMEFNDGDRGLNLKNLDLNLKL